MRYAPQGVARYRHLAVAAYMVGIALLLIPGIDAMLQGLPIRLGDVRWRFGLFGTMSNVFMTGLMGMLVTFVVATVMEHYRFQKVLGAVALLAALVATVALVMFALDALQLLREVRPEAKRTFKIASARAAIKTLLGVVTLSYFGIAAFRGPRQHRSAKGLDQSSMIIGAGLVGAGGPAPAAEDEVVETQPPK